ncbi:NUDIX hydrolase [Cryobacterium tepidiphilum]|uniref:NUDIX domain-containing protein n=1 Tax=Cryobacterium tepidiphilum TaxID=2486026 RepID=A0A3M8LET4_9MICO|nr:NUDIX domain-containing protein [Cryobacterium tepidiphilum]RNE64037.1 NUDIX domain-containing protein [Cryobacterium tepidiphilum]
MSEKAVYAAGAVCWRYIDGKLHVLLIHRTVHGDVTIPKGKVDPGETLAATAAREVEEETGLTVPLGVPLGVSKYEMPNGRTKIVHYWAAEVTADAIRTSTFLPNGEVAALEWVTIKKARSYLSYAPDVEIIDAFAKLVENRVTSTFALIALRHAKATPASDWDGPDASRPLTPRGVTQAADAVQSLAAWHPLRIITSSATRCVTTVAPLSAAIGVEIKRTDKISQDAFEDGSADVRAVIGKRVRAGKTAVLCSHGPVLPEILREMALATGTPLGAYVDDAAHLETGGFSVVHLSKTNPSSGIIAIETHGPRH